MLTSEFKERGKKSHHSSSRCIILVNKTDLKTEKISLNECLAVKKKWFHMFLDCEKICL